MRDKYSDPFVVPHIVTSTWNLNRTQNIYLSQELLISYGPLLELELYGIEVNESL